MVEKNPELGRALAESLGNLLIRANRAHIYDQLTSGIDDALDSTTYPILSGLERVGPATASQLGALIGLDRSVVSRHASRLEKSALLQRTTDSNDARSTLLGLSPRGRRAIAKSRRRMASLLADQLRTWPDSDAIQFVALLDRFVSESPLLNSPAEPLKAP